MLLLIVGIPVVVIALSTCLFYLVESGSVELGTVNKGELLHPPVRLTDAQLTTLDGNVYDYSKPPKWTFVVFGTKDCTGSCERMLYLARQSNTALAKKMDRVRRFYITGDGQLSDELKQQIDQHYKDLLVLSSSRESIEHLFRGSGIDPFQQNRFFVVDERGWIMMHYTADSIDEPVLNKLGKDVLKDMRRLIK